MNQIKIQKYIFNMLIMLLNVLLSYLIYAYKNYWYYFLGFITLNTAILMLQILILPCSVYIKEKKEKKYKDINNKNIIYCIPCYNESKTDLLQNIDSYMSQVQIQTHKRVLVIICDGKDNIGKNNDMSTDEILVSDIFKNHIDNIHYIKDAYKSDSEISNGLTIYTGEYEKFDIKSEFVIIIKENNKGKKDTLYLLRSLLYKFNNPEISNSKLSFNLINTINMIFHNYYINKFDAIIATDADTAINDKCFYYLIKELYNYNEKVVGIAGLVKIQRDLSICNFWYFYQFTNYLNGQMINRLHQSLITSRVSCLPGCLQILRINEVSCGLKTMEDFIKSRKDTNNIFKYIKYNLGEDVMHTMIMHKLYPKLSHTKQSLHAEAYTQVPLDLNTFLCQRRRWMLGGFMNELDMVKNNYNIYETIILIVFTITFLLVPFITVTYVIIATELISQDNQILFNIIILIAIFMIPKIYLVLIPMIINLSYKEIATLYLGLLTYNIIEVFLNLITYFYSFYHLDNISWGKTRENKNNDTNESFVLVNTPRMIEEV